MHKYSELVQLDQWLKALWESRLFVPSLIIYCSVKQRHCCWGHTKKKKCYFFQQIIHAQPHFSWNSATLTFPYLLHMPDLLSTRDNWLTYTGNYIYNRKISKSCIKRAFFFQGSGQAGSEGWKKEGGWSVTALSCVSDRQITCHCGPMLRWLCYKELMKVLLNALENVCIHKWGIAPQEIHPWPCTLANERSHRLIAAIFRQRMRDEFQKAFKKIHPIVMNDYGKEF